VLARPQQGVATAKVLRVSLQTTLPVRLRASVAISKLRTDATLPMDGSARRTDTSA